MQCSFQMDSGLPRDAVQINPVFNIQSAGGADPVGLTSDLATALNAKLVTWTTATKLTVKSYDVEEAKPRYPKATEVRSSTIIRNSPIPREVALCLSFYADHPSGRRRGRLYVPASLWTPTGAIGVRPTTGDRDTVKQLVPIFTGLGGINVDWGIWSERDHAFHKATDYWIDDEWDTQRRRGLRATVRTTGTTGE
jgi:hypothetical protein